MKNILKGKLGTALILGITVILAGVAIFTAIRLYQLGSQPVAPNVPSSIPQAHNINRCSLSFTIIRQTATPTPTATPTVTPTPTPVPECNSTCTVAGDCPSNLTCSGGYCRNSQCTDETGCVCPTATPTATPTETATPTGTPGPTGTPNSCNGTCGSDINCNGGLTCYQGFCRNSSCPNETGCNCPGPTATPVPPTLPKSGTDWPTITGAAVGVFVIIGSLMLAL